MRSSDVSQHSEKQSTSFGGKERFPSCMAAQSAIICRHPKAAHERIPSEMKQWMTEHRLLEYNTMSNKWAFKMSRRHDAETHGPSSVWTSRCAIKGVRVRQCPEGIEVCWTTGWQETTASPFKIFPLHGGSAGQSRQAGKSNRHGRKGDG